MARQRGNKWMGDALVNGARKRLTFDTLQQAEAFEANPYAYLGVSKSTLTIGLLFPQWAKEIYTGTRNAQNAFRIAGELVHRLGADVPITKLDRKRIKELVEVLRSVGNSDSTINTKMSILSKLLHYAVDEEVIEAAPSIPFFALPQGRIRSLTQEEEERLFSHLSDYHRAFATFLLYTGCRVGEALALRWEDIGKDRVTFWRTKTDRPRTVPLARKAVEAIQQVQATHIAENTQTPLSGLPRASTGPFTKLVYSTFIKDWTRAKDKAGLGHDPQVVPHVLRHTCATRLGKGKMSELRLQKWLGHSTLSMTARYTHLDVDDLQAGVDALEPRSGD